MRCQYRERLEVNSMQSNKCMDAFQHALHPGRTRRTLVFMSVVLVVGSQLIVYLPIKSALSRHLLEATAATTGASFALPLFRDDQNNSKNNETLSRHDSPLEMEHGQQQDFDVDAVFGDNMVLQHGSKAAIYGFLGPHCVGVEVHLHRHHKTNGTLVFRTRQSGSALLNNNVTATQQPFGSAFGKRPCFKRDCGKKLFPWNPWNQPLAKWEVLLPPQSPGGNYTIRVTCLVTSKPKELLEGRTLRTGEQTTSEINLVNVTFGDVWFCSGQSNMGLPLKYTFDRNDTLQAIRRGHYDNIRIMAGLASTPPYGASPHLLENWYPGYGKANGSNPWMTAPQAVADTNSTRKWLQFGATCWHFAQKLVDQGMVDTPIGLINTAVGESSINMFMDNTTIDTCHKRSTRAYVLRSGGTSEEEERRITDGTLFGTHILPFVDFTIKGWIWYQGEHNMNYLKGTSAANIGYGCQMKVLIDSWRTIWSQIPNTTAPLAPFGVVTLASSGGMGRPGLGMMRHAQTANYGVLPSPELPNTFLAQAYDLDDEWGAQANVCLASNYCDNHDASQDDVSCNSTKCIKERAWREACQAPHGVCAVARGTSPKKSDLHPRNKKTVGERLAIAAFNLVYGGTDAYTGPTLQGCSILEEQQSGKRILEVRFNSTLLRADRVSLVPYPPLVTPRRRESRRQGKTMGGSQLYVQANVSRFCMEPIVNLAAVEDATTKSQYYCPSWAGGNPNQTALVNRGFLDNGWIMLNYTMASTDEASNRNAIHVDLSPLPQGINPTAIRYAWGFVDCCDHTDPSLYVHHGCSANCPIRSSKSQLPANPFQAKIVNGKCECIAPQSCNG